MKESKEQIQALLRDPLLTDVLEYLPNKNFKSVDELTCDCDPILDASTLSKLLSQTESMLQAELGGACRIKLEREGHEDLNIIIKLDATVKELKKIIQLRIENEHKKSIKELRQKAMEEWKHIPENEVKRNKTHLPRYTNFNWKHVWKSKVLKLDDIKLLDDDKVKMKDVSLKNGSIVRFAPHCRNPSRSRR